MAERLRRFSPSSDSEDESSLRSFRSRYAAEEPVQTQTPEHQGELVVGTNSSHPPLLVQHHALLGGFLAPLPAAVNVLIVPPILHHFQYNHDNEPYPQQESQEGYEDPRTEVHLAPRALRQHGYGLGALCRNQPPVRLQMQWQQRFLVPEQETHEGYEDPRREMVVGHPAPLPRFILGQQHNIQRPEHQMPRNEPPEPPDQPVGLPSRQWGINRTSQELSFLLSPFRGHVVPRQSAAMVDQRNLLLIPQQETEQDPRAELVIGHSFVLRQNHNLRPPEQQRSRNEPPEPPDQPVGMLGRQWGINRTSHRSRSPSPQQKTTNSTTANHQPPDTATYTSPHSAVRRIDPPMLEEAGTHNGVFVWRIPDVCRRRREAVEGSSLYSPPFHYRGYRMCLRVYLNGDGSGKGTHISLFFVIMRGEFDDLLEWPFRHRVTLSLLDRSGRHQHITKTFEPDPQNSSFQRPRSEMNTALSFPEFAPLIVLRVTDLYVRDDVLYFRIRID